MNDENPVYGIKQKVSLSFEETVRRTKTRLQNKGFRIITEIDMKDALAVDSNGAFSDYIILEVCHPHLVLDVLKADLDAGLLLPCNIAIYKPLEGRAVFITAANPTAIMRITGQEDIIAFSEEIRDKLFRALDQIGRDTG
jgi:uncharacterized protein (DUF302 family)